MGDRKWRASVDNKPRVAKHLFCCLIMPDMLVLLPFNAGQVITRGTTVFLGQ